MPAQPRLQGAPCADGRSNADAANMNRVLSALSYAACMCACLCLLCSTHTAKAKPFAGCHTDMCIIMHMEFAAAALRNALLKVASQTKARR